jgi:hypothetical protein
MFRKKNKDSKQEPTVIKKDEVIEVTSKDISKVLDQSDKQASKPKTATPKPQGDRVSPSSFFSFEEVVEEKPKAKEVLKEESSTIEKEPIKAKNENTNAIQEENSVIINEVSEVEFIEENWIWFDSEEAILKREKDRKKKKPKRGKKGQEEQEEPQEKKDLNAYFREQRAKKQKLQPKTKPPVTKTQETNEGEEEQTDKKSKKRKKTKKDLLEEQIKDQKIYRYNNKKYTKVEDFITYLNAHYLDIEDIAREVLDDENFFGWVNKNSGMFQQSLKQFKEIKEKIEKK